MSAVEAASRAGSAAGASAPVRIPGHVGIAPRAYEQLLAAVSAQELGVRARRVRARTDDDGGRLVIHVTGAIDAAKAPFLEYLSGARERIAAETERLTGARVGRVLIHITDIDTHDRRTS
jgi:hypothetical protein